MRDSNVPKREFDSRPISSQSRRVGLSATTAWEMQVAPVLPARSSPSPNAFLPSTRAPSLAATKALAATASNRPAAYFPRTEQSSTWIVMERFSSSDKPASNIAWSSSGVWVRTPEGDRGTCFGSPNQRTT